MSELLAIHGGPKAKTTPNFPMYPGGLEIGKEELERIPLAKHLRTLGTLAVDLDLLQTDRFV